MKKPFMNHKKYMTQESIQKLFEKGKVNQLNEICHYNLENATWKLKFCDPKRGIYGSTPFDLVHAWQQGWYGYINGAFYSQKKAKGGAVAAKKGYLKLRKVIDLYNKRFTNIKIYQMKAFIMFSMINLPHGIRNSL
jgi:hypothetical protein